MECRCKQTKVMNNVDDPKISSHCYEKQKLSTKNRHQIVH